MTRGLALPCRNLRTHSQHHEYPRRKCEAEQEYLGTYRLIAIYKVKLHSPNSVAGLARLGKIRSWQMWLASAKICQGDSFVVAHNKPESEEMHLATEADSTQDLE